MWVLDVSEGSMGPRAFGAFTVSRPGVQAVEFEMLWARSLGCRV